MKIIRVIIRLITILLLMAGSFMVGKEYDTFLPSWTGSVSHDAGPVLLSCQDLQRELNRRYPKAKLVVDGKCGKQTQHWWDRAYGDQTAIELWPEESQ